MITNLRHLIKFPEKISKVTTGILCLNESRLITGHENGLVISWNLETGEYEQIYSCNSKIETIALSETGNIAIGSHLGRLIVISLKDSSKLEVIQEEGASASSRIWRTLWLPNNSLISTSTYGAVKVRYKDESNKWTTESLTGHTDSVFSICKSNNLIATGDYFGNILIRDIENLEYITQKLKIQHAVEAMDWYQDKLLAAINYVGRIYLFEKEYNEQDMWKLVFEIDNATTQGTALKITGDGKTVFAATDNEIIQFDLDTQQIDVTEQKGTKNIFLRNNTVYILTGEGLFFFERMPVEVKEEFIKYKYIKISLVGHTGVGKSTLCNHITTGEPGEDKSTLGKRVWNWEIPTEGSLKKRIILYDYGGQETALSTFLPFLPDSDIILILFQQNDINTFKKAIEILDSLTETIPERVKIFLVQTHIDQPMAEIDENKIKQLIEDNKIEGILKVCPKKSKSVENFKDELQSEIPWENARTMIRSQYSNAVLKIIFDLQNKYSAIAFNKFKKVYEEWTKQRIATSHLRFLLRDFSSQGIIEYYPEISDLIIFNDPDYNELKTQIPIYVMTNKGIVSFDALKREFNEFNQTYLSILDAVYQEFKICVKNNNDYRIFPKLLPDKPITISEKYEEFFKDKQPQKKQIFLREQKIDIGRLIEALSDLNLQCINVSKKDGLFAWENNALIYFSFNHHGNALAGFHVECTFYIGGENYNIRNRLTQEFTQVIEQLYGPSLKQETSNQGKKKASIKREIKYDVALSFAGEQRDFARNIAEKLKNKGYSVFFDEFEEYKMWGKDLAEYLTNVYYKQSRYCIMLVSKEYISKAWPTHERRCAVARSIENFDKEYILPVKFDSSDIPGLPPTVKYIKVTDNTSPETIAELFIRKFRENE